VAVWLMGWLMGMHLFKRKWVQPFFCVLAACLAR